MTKSRGTSEVARLGRMALAQDAPLVLLVVSYSLIGVFSSRFVGIPPAIHWMISWRLIGTFTLLYIVGASLATLVYVVVARGQSIRRKDTWKWLGSALFSRLKLLSFGVVFVAFSTMMPVFVAFKSSIPLFQPFSWDVAFMAWDRWLHFGYHPHELLQPVLGMPGATKLIDTVYFSWIHVMWFTVVWQAWHGSRATAVRSQFLLSFALCWIVLGSLLATLLSSAGPIYFGDVAGMPDPYGPLMEYLRTTNETHPLRVLRVRDLLWAAYVSPGDSIVAGISAMPSLHIAIAVLMAFLGFSINRWLGWAYTAFAIAIFIGSIHLAWHYAIDGYFSAVAVAAIWWVSGRIVRWWPADPIHHTSDLSAGTNGYWGFTSRK